MRRTTRTSIRPVLALSLAWRGLIRDPASTALAVTILALGISLPATFFSVLVGAIRPLPVPEGDRVVRVEVVQPSRDGRPLPVTLDDVEVLRSAASLQSLGAFRTFEGALVDRAHAASRVSAAALTSGVLPMLRVAPRVGRMPTADEAGSALLIGDDVWRDLYEADPAVIGRSVDLDGVPRTIVGVMPAGFGFPFKQNAWVPLDRSSGSLEGLELVGRLADGAESTGATAELAPRWSRRDAERDTELTGGVLTVRAYTGNRGEAGEAVAFIGLVLVALCLLVIACANVANLLLVRATERVRALGIQTALGAGRAQIGLQLFLESLLVAVAGGAAGLLIASWTVTALERALAAQHFGYYWMRLSVDGPVLLFTLALIGGTALVAGILPMMRVMHVDVQHVLKEEGAAAAVGGGGPWSRAFVTAQLAVSCGALVAAALTGQSLAGSRNFGGELPTEQMLLGAFDLPADLEPEARALRLDAIADAIGAIPGARSAALAVGAPAFGERYSSVEVRGSALDARAATTWNAISPGYLDVVGTGLRAGRSFTAADDAGAAPVAVVSEAFARRYSADAAVLGRTLRLPAADSTAWFTVVGVVADLDLGMGPKARADRVYLPLAQIEAHEVMAVLRADGDAAAWAPALRAAFVAVDPTMPLWNVRTLRDAHAYLIRIPRVLAAMAFAGGTAGLLVAVVGLYGLLAFRVRQRRRELGVRLALGADASRLARDVLGSALRQLLPAVVIGLALAWVASPILTVMLLGADPRRAATYVGVALGFTLAGMAGALVPALRAGATRPADALRGA